MVWYGRHRGRVDGSGLLRLAQGPGGGANPAAVPATG
jgi:hypothetical protein